MLTIKFDQLGYHTPKTRLDQKPEASRLPPNYHNNTDARGFGNVGTPLADRICLVSLNSTASSPTSREQLGGKGMFLQRMVEIGLPVPPFKCATKQMVNALEQYPFDTVRLARYLPEIVAKLEADTSLADIKQYLQTLPPSEQAKKNKWLAGLTQFVASDDFYEQVKDSQAARDIRALRAQLGKPSTPLIVRSSGINEDNYGDAQAGKYLSEVQGEDDVLRTCLKVMASSYRPEVCAGGAPQPMALILQQCIDCQYGGVVMSYQSLQDDTVRVEYTSGQPRGAVAGHYGTTPHRIDIVRKKGTDHPQYFPGTVSSHFILRKNSANSGYTEIEIDVGAQSDSDRQRLTNGQISSVMQMVRMLEGLLGCPIDAEIAVDHLGQVFLLQARPITRLSGGMDFAMPPPAPEKTLASGIGVSEGYCTGPLWLATNQAIDSMPEGAIVVARHGEVWMLEPQYLKRAAGFVFATGGTNDHVAITLRQAEKPCLLAGDQYPAVADYDSKQATLAYARFNGTPDAFVVTGDITGRLASHRCLSSAFSDVPSAQAVASRDDLSPPDGTFSQVATAFRWLTDQNARLLAFFAPGGGLDCLANPIKLSMSAQRAEILAVTQDNINLLIRGAQAMLDGYQAFLQLANGRPFYDLKSMRHELPQLDARFERLQQTIKSELESVILPLQASAGQQQVSQGSFRQWVAACHQLQASLQALDPRRAEQISSIHELIFILHQRFVKALGLVAVASGQGRKLSSEEGITYLDFTLPGEETGLLRPSGKALIEKIGYPGSTVVSMADALIANIKNLNHICSIELLEKAEGGKGRTLRLKFSDQFDNHISGKLKRMWFLTQLLRAIEFDKAGSMQLSSNPVTGHLIVECSHMASTETLHDAFEKLMTVFSDLDDLDINLDKVDIFAGAQWSFNLFAQIISRDLQTEADKFAFRLCLFSINFRQYYCLNHTPGYYPLLSKQLQQLIDYSRKLSTSKHNFREVLLSDEIDEITRKELLQYFLLIKPEIATPMIEDVYSELHKKYFVVKPSHSGHLEFSIEPDQLLTSDKEEFKRVLLEHGLKYASQQVRSDKDVVLPTMAKHASDLKYVSEELKNDKDVVLAAVSRSPFELEYASPELQDNDEVVMAAIAQHPGALGSASERIRSDKKILQIVTDRHESHLARASKTVLNDREYLLDLIERNPDVYKVVPYRFSYDEEFIRLAVERNPKVKEFL